MDWTKTGWTKMNWTKIRSTKRDPYVYIGCTCIELRNKVMKRHVSQLPLLQQGLFLIIHPRLIIYIYNRRA